MSSFLRLLAGVLLPLCALAAGAAAETLYDPVSRYASLYMTARPKKVGDIITIVIDERSLAQEKSDTEVQKKTDINSSVDGISMLNPFGKKYPLSPLFKFTGQNDYDGEGETNQSNRVNAQIAATVVRVLDTGNLLIEGRRQIHVGKDQRSIVITGQVRPEDVRPDNTIMSTNVADAVIRYEGSGPVSNAGKPTLLHRLLDWLPFF